VILLNIDRNVKSVKLILELLYSAYMNDKMVLLAIQLLISINESKILILRVKNMQNLAGSR